MKIIFFIICFLIIVFIFGMFLYQNYYYGDYIINKQWISSVSEETNITYCDNCLWIEFYEGCNRYRTYYFKNHKEFDKRLSIGQPVNIKFQNWFIKGITLAKKYKNKC
jgi:hypothetical protein